MIKRILLDMDGVLVDFVQGACDLHNIPWPYNEGTYGTWDFIPLTGIKPSKFWALMGYEFWKNLSPYPYMHQIVEALEAKFGREHICLLTSPPRTEGAIEGKIAWIRNHLPQFRRHFLVGPAKQFCASSNHALIDDSEKNVAAFTEAGGRALLVPHDGNRRHGEDQFSTVMEWIDSQ